MPFFTQFSSFSYFVALLWSAKNSSIEQKISDYQAENNCCLPSTLLQRQNQLAALQGQSVQREQNIFTLEEQIRTLEQQLRDGILRNQAQKTPEELQLDSLRLQLQQTLPHLVQIPQQRL